MNGNDGFGSRGNLSLIEVDHGMSILSNIGKTGIAPAWTTQKTMR